LDRSTCAALKLEASKQSEKSVSKKLAPGCATSVKEPTV